MGTSYKVLTPTICRGRLYHIDRLYEMLGEATDYELLLLGGSSKPITICDAIGKSGQVLIALDGAKVIGVLRWSSLLYGGKSLRELFIKKEYRAQGVGTALVHRLLSSSTSFCVAASFIKNEDISNFLNKNNFKDINQEEEAVDLWIWYREK